MRASAIMLIFGVILEFLIGAFQNKAEEQTIGRNREVIFHQRYGEIFAALIGFGTSVLIVASYFNHANIASNHFIVKLGLFIMMLVVILFLGMGLYLVSKMGEEFAIVITTERYNRKPKNPRY